MMIMTPSVIINHHYDCMITDYCSTGLLLSTPQYFRSYKAK